MTITIPDWIIYFFSNTSLVLLGLFLLALFIRIIATTIQDFMTARYLYWVIRLWITFKTKDGLRIDDSKIDHWMVEVAEDWGKRDVSCLWRLGGVVDRLKIHHNAPDLESKEGV